jgi:hypothetical protein
VRKTPPSQPQRIERCQHRFGVTGHLDLAPLGAQHARPVDQKGRPLDAHVAFAIHGFLGPDAIAFAQIAVFIRRQDHAQTVLGHEFVMGFHAVLRHADHHRPRGGKVIGQRGEIPGLGRAARGVILGIEIKHHRPRTQRRQRDRVAAIAGQGKVRGGAANFGHLVLSLCSVIWHIGA